MADQVETLSKLIAEARRWVLARETLRRAMDSKKATPADVKKAQQAVISASNSLEKAIRALLSSVQQLPSKRPSRPLDWGKIAGVVAHFAGSVEKAVQMRSPSVIDVEVIDTDGRTVR